jgi:hypothetical protein
MQFTEWKTKLKNNVRPNLKFSNHISFWALLHQLFQALLHLLTNWYFGTCNPLMHLQTDDNFEPVARVAH